MLLLRLKPKYYMRWTTVHGQHLHARGRSTVQQSRLQELYALISVPADQWEQGAVSGCRLMTATIFWFTETCETMCMALGREPQLPF